MEVAHTSEIGISKYKEKAFDLVLCDYRLDDKDGGEVLKFLKGDRRKRALHYAHRLC